MHRMNLSASSQERSVTLNFYEKLSFSIKETCTVPSPFFGKSPFFFSKTSSSQKNLSSFGSFIRYICWILQFCPLVLDPLSLWFTFAFRSPVGLFILLVVKTCPRAGSLNCCGFRTLQSGAPNLVSSPPGDPNLFFFLCPPKREKKRKREKAQREGRIKRCAVFVFCGFFPSLWNAYSSQFYFLFISFLEPWKPPPQNPPKGKFQRHRQNREKPPCLAKEKAHPKGHTSPRTFSNLVGKNENSTPFEGDVSSLQHPTRF